jgi:hypothetical protein
LVARHLTTIRRDAMQYACAAAHEYWIVDHPHMAKRKKKAAPKKKKAAAKRKKR